MQTAIRLLVSQQLERGDLPAAAFSPLAVAALLLGLLVAFPGRSQAQQCFPLRPTNDELGYKLRHNRCEGLYQSNVAGESLLIVSLLDSPLGSDAPAGGVLRVAPAFNPQTSLNIRAVPLAIRTYYRMDAILRPGEDLTWPVAEVLSRIRLGTSKLGIYGWYGPESDKVLVPLRVTREGTAAAQRQLTLTVRASNDITRAVWHWAVVKNNQCVNYTDWQDAATGSVAGANLINVPLASITSALVCLEVKAKQRNADWLPPLRTKIRRS